MRGCSAVSVLEVPDRDQPASKHFSVNIERIGNIAVMRCAGRLCFDGEARQLAEAAQKFLNSRADLVLELGALEVLDSAGIGQLVLISMQAKACGQDVSIARASDRVRRLLELTNVASLFEFLPSVEAAVSGRSVSAA